MRARGRRARADNPRRRTEDGRAERTLRDFRSFLLRERKTGTAPNGRHRARRAGTPRYMQDSSRLSLLYLSRRTLLPAQRASNPACTPRQRRASCVQIPVSRRAAPSREAACEALLSNRGLRRSAHQRQSCTARRRTQPQR